jgi:hypothetical protein
MANFITDTVQTETNLIGHGFATDITSITSSATTTQLVSTDPHTFFVTGSTTGQIMALPNATTLRNGQQYWILNASTASITCQQFGGSNAVTINPNGAIRYVLRDNSTTAGVWNRAVSSSSTFAGTAAIGCSYSANAGTGRFLEFYPSNSSDTSPFLVVTASTLVAMSIVATASSTCTVSVYKNGSFVTSIASLSLAAQTANSTITLTTPLAANDTLSVEVTSGSLNKPGVTLYIAT